MFDSSSINYSLVAVLITINCSVVTNFSIYIIIKDFYYWLFDYLLQSQFKGDIYNDDNENLQNCPTKLRDVVRATDFKFIKVLGKGSFGKVILFTIKVIFTFYNFNNNNNKVIYVISSSVILWRLYI